MKNLILSLVLTFASLSLSAQKVGLELSIDPNPNFIENWTFNVTGQINDLDNLRMVFSYSSFMGWQESVVGFDYSLFKLRAGKIKIPVRFGFQAGDCTPGEFAFKGYLKEELTIKNSNNCSVGFVLYQNLHKNTRRNGEIYGDFSFGLRFSFNPPEKKKSL